MSSAVSEKRRGRGAILLLIVALATGALFLRRPALVKPVLIGKTSAQPESLRISKGVWYWIEKPPKAEMILAMASASEMRPILKNENISSFDVSDGKLVWAQKQGANWAVMLGNADGGGARALWSGAETPMSVKFAEGRIYWLRKKVSALDDQAPFPPLLSSLEAVSVPLEGGSPQVRAQLEESETGEILGAHEGALYIAAYRHATPGAMTLYRLPKDSRQAQRLVGAAENPQALLAKNGTLYWLEVSQEVAFPQRGYCVYRMDATGKREPLSDWLPAQGKLYETDSGVLYADSEYVSGLWRIGARDVFPVSLPIPEGFYGVAAGENEALVARYGGARVQPTLYRMPLP